MQPTDSYNRLVLLPLFQGMSRNELHQVVAHTKLGFLKVAQGRTAYCEGEHYTAIPMLTDGTLIARARADNGTYTLEETVNAPAIIEPERLFGLTQHFSRTYTAHTACRFVNLTKAEVLRLATHHDIFLLNLLNIVSTHTQRLGRQPWRTQQLTIRQKIARFVEQRALRPAGEIRLYVTMQTLAAAIGESRINLSRQLNELQKQGIIQLHRAHIYIPALEKLINE